MYPPGSAKLAFKHSRLMTASILSKLRIAKPRRSNADYLCQPKYVSFFSV
jgi:hypothetical protein